MDLVQTLPSQALLRHFSSAWMLLLPAALLRLSKIALSQQLLQLPQATERATRSLWTFRMLLLFHLAQQPTQRAGVLQPDHH
jgi:hypothetical protein